MLESAPHTRRYLEWVETSLERARRGHRREKETRRSRVAFFKTLLDPFQIGDCAETRLGYYEFQHLETHTHRNLSLGAGWSLWAGDRIASKPQVSLTQKGGVVLPRERRAYLFARDAHERDDVSNESPPPKARRKAPLQSPPLVCAGDSRHDSRV